MPQRTVLLHRKEFGEVSSLLFTMQDLSSLVSREAGENLCRRLGELGRGRDKVEAKTDSFTRTFDGVYS